MACPPPGWPQAPWSEAVLPDKCGAPTPAPWGWGAGGTGLSSHMLSAIWGGLRGSPAALVRAPLPRPAPLDKVPQPTTSGIWEQAWCVLSSSFGAQPSVEMPKQAHHILPGTGDHPPSSPQSLPECHLRGTVGGAVSSWRWAHDLQSCGARLSMPGAHVACGPPVTRGWKSLTNRVQRERSNQAGHPWEPV